MAAQRYDAIIIGSGIGGGTCARRLREGGMRVALIERELIGGETARWASIPSATVLGPSNVLWRLREAAGVKSPSMLGSSSRKEEGPPYHGDPLDHLADEAQVEHWRRQEVEVIQGDATFTGPGQLEVGGRALESERIVIATGSEPYIPGIEGLAEAGYWTAREAMSFTSLPAHVVILGGSGTHAIELAQMFRMYSAEVTLVVSAERLAPQEDPEVGALIAQHLHQSAIRVLTGQSAQRLQRGPDGTQVVTLDDEKTVQGQVVVAMGRTPRVAGLGLERVGVQMSGQGIRVDPHCRVAAGVWAVGDVTGTGSYIHLAHYQGRIAADDMLGRPHPASYTSVPRVSFTDPLIAATGLTLAQAREQGIDVASVTMDLSKTPIHPGYHPIHTAVEHSEVGGRLTVHADRGRNVMIGAWAVTSDAGDWIQPAVFAIRTATPLDVLYDMFEQYPALSEVYLGAVERLMF